MPGTEEDTSSIASSPTSTGPLSPKTPTTIKSTSQVGHWTHPVHTPYYYSETSLISFLYQILSYNLSFISLTSYSLFKSSKIRKNISKSSKNLIYLFISSGQTCVDKRGLTVCIPGTCTVGHALLKFHINVPRGGTESDKSPTSLIAISSFQELFEDRRRGKTASISSDQNEVSTLVPCCTNTLQSVRSLSLHGDQLLNHYH